MLCMKKEHAVYLRLLIEKTEIDKLLITNDIELQQKIGTIHTLLRKGKNSRDADVYYFLELEMVCTYKLCDL